MIKIIKEAQKEFIAKCKRCYCEFSYELEDLKDKDWNCVECPCCGFLIPHLKYDNEIASGESKKTLDITDTNTWM